jgi:hypothetical protein
MGPRLSWPWLLGLILAGPTFAQAPASDVYYSRQLVFRIPYSTDAGERRVKEVQLYASTDQGRSWQPYANTSADQPFFKFTAEHDGLFWFAVRTVDLEGRAYPPTLEGLRPGLKVVVDTQQPTVNLRTLPARDGEANVEWEVRDENLDPAGLRLEYRLPGGPEWVAVPGEVPAHGQRAWRPGTNGTIEVRLQARDRAGNTAEQKTTVTLGGLVGNAGITPREEPQPTNNNGGPPVHLVNSKRISINYKIDDVGPSGVSTVELWYTQDGRSWQKYKEAERDAKPPMIVDVNGEGVYGFTILVRSGVGLGDRPPQVGDAPHIWVEVDLTEPVVKFHSVEVGRGLNANQLTLAWTATDKNLGKTPISLSYAEKADGVWTPIASSLDNTGRYVWQMPSGVPYKFIVRVQATDRAGNVGTAILKDAAAQPVPIIVDLAQPKARVLEVTPTAK